jgi:hypothetical protein
MIMKRLLLVLAFASVLPFVSFAQWGGDPTNKKLNASEFKAPVITWTIESYNFGEIPQGKPVDVVFEFTNTGNAPLIISKVEPACNCTDAIWPKTPIMPGQKGEIQVTFDAATGGKFSKTAVVTSNAKPTEQTLVFTGTVVKK